MIYALMWLLSNSLIRKVFWGQENSQLVCYLKAYHWPRVLGQKMIMLDLKKYGSDQTSGSDGWMEDSPILRWQINETVRLKTISDNKTWNI